MQSLHVLPSPLGVLEVPGGGLVTSPGCMSAGFTSCLPLLSPQKYMHAKSEFFFIVFRSVEGAVLLVTAIFIAEAFRETPA